MCSEFYSHNILPACGLTRTGNVIFISQELIKTELTLIIHSFMHPLCNPLSDFVPACRPARLHSIRSGEDRKNLLHSISLKTGSAGLNRE